jgi:hypothetical protein
MMSDNFWFYHKSGEHSHGSASVQGRFFEVAHRL